MIDLGAIGLDF